MHHVESCDYLPTGQDVTIVQGAFAGMRGILLQHKKPNRVVITVAAIMCSFSIEVDVDDVRCTTGMLTEAFA
jgi:transcription antitermination factor NusG